MKKLACSLLTIIILFTISCEIGLGSSVDTEPPSLSIAADIADKVIRDDFVLRGTYSDDGTVSKLSAVLKRTDKNGEPLEYDGVIIENLKKRGSGTWTIDIPAKSKSIKDGTYQADVSITDSLGRTTVQSTIFTIDNTPPIIILTRPSTALESTSSDTYGQKFTIEGAAAEKNDIGRMEIQLYTDEDCTIPAAEEPIVLTNVPSSIEVEAANYDVEQAKYIYKGITQSFFIDVPTDGEGREFYYKLFAYDGAKRYLPEDETPSDDDLKGNRAEYFFLQKDIYENIQQYYTITEMYSILSDNYFESSTNRAADAPLPEQVRNDLLDDSKYQRTIGKFNLNPKNNPTYTVTGRSPLASLTKSSFENDDNALIIGGQLIIEVSPGLDGHILKEDTIKIYTQQYTFTDGTPVVGTPVEITQYERKESGNTYKYITNINREDGYEIGKFYTVYVEGKDVKNNTIVSAGNNPYGFRLISNGRAPVINLSEPEDVTTYTNKKQIFKGTAEVELGIPVVNVYKGIVSESTKVKTIEFTEEQGYKEGSDFVFDFTYEDETFDGKTGKSKFLFETDLGGQKSTQPQERTVIYDMDLPTISITKPTTAKNFKADGSEEAGAYLNGEVEFTVMLNDKGGSGLDSESNKPKWEIFDASNKTTPLASGFITETTGETISINTAESKYNGKTIIFRVTAWDVAGNEKSTEADDSKYTFIVDQTTDIPFICEDTDYGKVKFSLNSVDAYMAQSAEAKFGTVKKSSTLKFKVYEDDGTANITILKKKLNITKNNDGTYTSDWTNDLSAFDEEEAFKEEIDTPNKLVTMNTYSFPSTDAECGYYEYVIIATDKSDKSASPRNTIKGPFIVRITKDEASITVEKDFDYRNENSEFTNTITIIPSEGPYKLYRQVVVDGEQYNDTSFGDTDIAEYKLIKDNIPDTTLIHEDKLKLSTYAHDKNITVYYKVIDGASQASASQSVVLKYDNAAFAPEIKAPIAGKTGKQALTETTQISARLRDDRAGVEKVFYKFTHNSNPGTEMGTAGGGYESEPASNGSFALDPDFVEGLTASTNQLCEGKWFFHIYTEDGAGNVSAVETREFDIDMKSPVITTTLDDTAISTDAVHNKNAAYTFKFKITETNALDASEPVTISVKKGTTPISYTIKDGTDVVYNLNEIIAGKDYTIEIPDADGLYTYTITVKDFVGKDAKVERVVQYDTTPPVAKHEIDTKQKDLYFRIGDYSNDAGVPDVGGKYSGGTYGNALTIQIRGYFDDEGSGINKFYYKTFKDLEVMVDSTKATGSEPVEESETIYFNSPDVLKNYVIANNTGTFFPLDEPEEKNVDYNTAAGKATKAIVSNYKTTIKGFQEGKNYLVLVAEDNVGNTAVDYAEIEGVGRFYCYSLNVDITSPSIPTKEDENLFTNIDSTNTDSNVHFYIEGTVSDKPNKPNGSAGLASVVFTRDGGTGSIELKASDLTEPTTEDIAAVPDDSTLKHWKVDVKSLLPSSGTAIISAKVTDNAGYEVSVPVANITVDRTAPEVIINSPVADAKIGATNLIINGTASDGNGAGISSDKLKVYYTKSESLGTATAAPVSTDFGTAIAEKWVELGEVTSGAIWTYTKPDINATETIASNNENTSLYFMVSAKDKSGTGNVGYSSPRKVTVDRKAPVFVSGKFNGNETTSTDAWINNRTVNLEGSFIDTHAGVEGSGVTSIFYKFYETGDETSLANAVEKVIPTTDGSYNTNVNLDDSISNASFEIWAKDSAGNVSAKKTYLIKVDYTAPNLSASYYKKGTDSVTATGSTVYIKNQGGGTNFVLYGNYNDGSNQSGVKALVFKKNGAAFTTPTVTYSATAIENDTIPDDSTYAAYNNTAAAGYNSWKATFSLNETARITVEGEDNAGNKATTVSAIDVTFDNTNPVLSNLNFTETKGGVTKDVYSSGSGDTLKYFTNNSAAAGRTFKISGIATDNIGIQSVSLDVETNPTTSPATKLETQTINEPNGNWEFDITGWSDWTGAKAKVTVKDKAGNTVSKELNISFDTTDPVISELKLNNLALASNADTSNTWYKSQIIPLSVKVETQTGDSGIASVEYATQKSGETGELSWTAVTTKDNDGNYVGSAIFEAIGTGQKLYIRVTDNAGNLSYFKTNNTAVTINIDTTAPSVTPPSVTPPSVTSFSTNGSGDDITVIGTASDAESGLDNIVVTVGGTDFSQTITAFTGSGTEKSWTATIPANSFGNNTTGDFTIYAKATNKAGLASSRISVGTINVDTASPTITITSPVVDAKVAGTFAISGTATDGAGSGLSNDENDKIILYYTKSTTLGTVATAPTSVTAGSDITSSWVVLDNTLSTSSVWEKSNTISTDVAANGANTDVYVMASVKDNAGNTGYSLPRKVTVDRKMPEVGNQPSGFGDGSAWVNRSTITFAGSFTDAGGTGANTIYYLIGDVIGEVDGVNHQPKTIPTTNGSYDTNITVDTNGENVHVHIWAEDKAGNNFINTITANDAGVKTLPTTGDDYDEYINFHRMYTVRLDASAPTIESKYFQKGENGALTATLDSAYVTDNTTITLYGNYEDGANESGVDELTFKNNGTAFASNAITVTYSTTEITDTASITGATFAAYAVANKTAYKSWKAVFSVNGSNNRISAEGKDIAGNPVTETVLDIKVDTAAPVVTITSPTGNTTKTGYDSLTIGGTVSDGTGSGLSNDDIKVYYTKDSTEGSATSITTLDTSKWTHFGTMSSAAAWTFTNANIDITYPGTIASDAANTDLYFTVEAKDKAGNIGYSAPCKIVIDRKKPTLKTGKVNGVDDTSEAWMSNTSLNIEGEFTDTHDGVTGSGVSMVYWRIGADSSSNPGTGLPTTDGKYNTIIDMPDGSSTLYIWAKDAAGNISSEQPYSVNIDGSAPTVDVKYYKKGSTGTLTQASGIVYVNDETEITLYGNYKDEQSGVQALKFEREGTDISSNVTVTYSTTEIGTDGTVPTDSTYKALSTLITDTANTTNTIRSWKAVYTPGANGAGRLTVEGRNRSSLNKVATAFDIVVDTDDPTPSFTSHTSSSVVNGNVRLAGSVTDESNSAITAISLTATSGTNTKEFAYPAVSGKGTITYANGQWSIASSDFDTTELYNGVTSPTTANLTLTLTATDAAGNTGTGTLSMKIDQNEDRPVVKFTNISNEGTDAAPQYILKYGTNASLEGTVSDDDATSAAVVQKFLVSSTQITSETDLTAWTESPSGSGTWTHETYGTTKFNKATGDYTYTPANTSDGPKNIYFYVKDNDGKEFFTAYTTGESAVLYRPFQQYKTSAKVSNDAVLTYKSDSNAPVINSVQMQAWKAETGTATSDKSGDLMSLGENCTVGGSSKNYVDIRVSAKDANGVKGIVIKVENGDTVTYYRSNANVSAEGVTTYVDTGTVAATSSDSTNHEYTTSRINITNFAHGSKKVTVRVYDNSGLYNNQETVFEVDRNAPNVIIDSPAGGTGLYGSNGVQDASVTVRGHSDSDAVKVYMAVKGYTNASSPNTADTPDETDYEQISKSVGTSWNAIFNGKKGTASTTDFYEERFNTWVDEIYGDGTSINPSVTEKKLRLYFYAEDAMGNKGDNSPSTLDLTIYTQGDRPTVEIASPEKPKTVNGVLTPATVGGTITITGSTTIALSSVQDIWLQIDPSYETSFNTNGWESELRGLLTGKTVDYSIENTNIDGIGKAIKANGSKASWNLAINSAGEFNTTGNNNRTIAVRAYAVSATGKVSGYDELYFVLDPSAPVFGQRKDTSGNLISPLRLVQFANNEDGTGDETASILYEPDLWLSGKWWLKGSVSDAAGIGSLMLDNDSVDSSFLDDYETIGSYKNYEMCIPLEGNGEYNKKLAAQEGVGTKTAEQTIKLNFDNTAPQFSSNLSDSGNQIVQDHGVYEMSGSFTDPDGSGFKRIAFYVTRTINGTAYLADIMKEQGTAITDNNVVLSTLTHTAGDNLDLYWERVTGCTTQNDREILVARTEATLKFIRKGSLCRINDVIYRINNVEAIEGNTTQLKLTIDSKVQNATGVTVDFALAQVIDNTVTENGTTESYDRTYDIDPATFEEGEESKINETKFSNDDGDQMVEAYRSSSGEWNVSINSQNIKDGAITIHFVAYDKAGNATYKSYSGTVSNNAPRIAGVKFGTDVNGDEDVSDSEMKETYSGLYNTKGLHKVDGITENGLASNGNKIQKLALPNNNKDVTKINNNADPIMSVKGKIKIIPEIVGGNEGLGWKWAVGTYESGYTSLNDAIHSGTTAVRDDDTTEFVVDTAALLNPQVGLSDGPQVFTFTISDKTGTTLGDSNCGKAELLLKLNVALNDGDNPTAGIEPFYWRTNSAGVLENSLYYTGTGSSKKVQGHIELPKDLPSGTFNYMNDDDELEDGEYDMDPKVSGIIYLEGFAKDNVVVEELALRVTEGSTTGSWITVAKRKRAGDTSAPSGTLNGAFYATTTLAANGMLFESATEKTETTGGIDYNVVNWKIAIDTSKIAANVAGTDIKIEVQAKDRKLPSLSNGTVSYSGAQRSSELSTLQTGLKQNSAGTAIDYTNNTLTFDSTYKTPYYKVDVVPYITKLYTNISDTAGEEFARSATGKYVVRGKYRAKVNGTWNNNLTETVRMFGFNLAAGNNVVIDSAPNTKLTTTASTANETTKYKGSHLTFPVGTSTSSGKLSITVNGVTSLNNVNASPTFAVGATQADDDSAAMYNSQANGKTNDRLTDDVDLWVWDMNYFLNETNITSPMLKMDKAGNYYMSYGYEVNWMYVNKNGTTRCVDGSYNKFHNTNVLYDENGNIYAVATNTDRVEDYSSKFAFYTPYSTTRTDQMPPEVTAKNGEYQYSSSSNTTARMGKRHLEMVYNDDTGVYNINRVKLPKIVSYTNGNTTNIGIAYFDGNNTENPVKVRFGSRNGQTISGGISGNTSATTVGGQSNNPNTTDSSYKDYHIVASDKEGMTFHGGQYAAVGLVPNGNSYVGVVAWYDADARRICYSYNTAPGTATADTDSQWQQHAVYLDEEYTGWYVDLTVDGNNGIHIAYYNSAKGNLKYAYIPSYSGVTKDAEGNLTGGAEVVTVDSYLSVGTNITINSRLQNSNYVPYIYYYNSSSNQTPNSIKVAWRKDFTALRNGADPETDLFTGAWESMTVPTPNIPVEATVCGGVPSSATGTTNTYKNTTVFLGYMSDKFYEKAYIKGDITQ